MALEKVIHF